MIIGFDGSRAFNKHRTGTENYSYQLLLNFSKIDLINQYIVYLRSGRDKVGEWPKNFKFVTICWPRLWTQGGLALQTFKDKLDVLFVPSHTLPLIYKPGLKTVVTVHDLGSEYLPAMHQLKQRLYLGFMQKHQLKSASKIIAVSKATKQDLIKKLGIDAKKISVVYEGYDREKFKVPAGGEARQRRQSLKFKVNQTIKKYNLIDQNYFLFVGTVQPRKNLERLIRAFSVIARSRATKQSRLDKHQTKIATLPSVARNDNIDLVIAGSKGWMSEEIYKLPKKLGIEHRVRFLGYISDIDLPFLYSGATALVFPSLFEGFGLPILEAQACGVPVITSNLSSMPEIAAKGAILVNPYSVDDIVKGMERVKGKAERVKLVKAGFENLKRFSWEKCARETLEVMRSVIPAKAGIHK